MRQKKSRTFQRWVKKGVLERIWAKLVEDCEALSGVDWRWHSADGAIGKARFGGTMSVPTPRIVRRDGTKRSVIVEADGGPLDVVVERTLGCMNKCRAILIRYAKKSCNYLGRIQLCCGLLWYRRQHRLNLLR